MKGHYVSLVVFSFVSIFWSQLYCCIVWEGGKAYHSRVYFYCAVICWGGGGLCGVCFFFYHARNMTQLPPTNLEIHHGLIGFIDAMI